MDGAQVIWVRTQGLVHWQGGVERLTHSGLPQQLPRPQKVSGGGGGGGNLFPRGSSGVDFAQDVWSSPGDLLFQIPGTAHPLP